MRTTLSAAKAKSRFAECLRRVEGGEPVVITRHKRAVVAMIPAHDLDEIERLRALPPEAGLAGLVGRFPDGASLARDLEATARRRARPRRVLGPGG